MHSAISRMSQKDIYDILTAIFGGNSKSKEDSKINPHFKVVIGDPLMMSGVPDEPKETKESEERDLLGELTASFILDGLDVTRKDTLMMVLFDNRLRIANGEKLTHHINLVHRK